METVIKAGSAKMIHWTESPDGVSLIQVWSATRGNRTIYLVRRANLVGEEVVTVATRTTEAQARKRANLVWLCDKFGDAEGNARYVSMYRNA